MQPSKLPNNGQRNWPIAVDWQQSSHATCGHGSSKRRWSWVSCMCNHGWTWLKWRRCSTQLWPFNAGGYRQQI